MSVAAHNNLALVLAASGDLVGAGVQFLKAGDKAAASYNIGIVHLAEGQYVFAAAAFEEDFWAELRITTTNPDHRDAAKFHLTANCARCVSINVDYATGKPGTGDCGSVLKTLMKDRRVDKGVKYSPIFGRYGFLDRGSTSGSDGNNAGMCVRVGDRVEVAKRNVERTVFGELANEKNDTEINPPFPT